MKLSHRTFLLAMTLSFLSGCATQHVPSQPSAPMTNKTQPWPAPASFVPSDDNRKRLTTLKTYEVGKTTRQQFLNDKWNCEDPVHQKFGVVALRKQFGLYTYVIGCYPVSEEGLDKASQFYGATMILDETGNAGPQINAPPLRWFGDVITPGDWSLNGGGVAVVICWIRFSNDVLQFITFDTNTESLFQEPHSGGLNAQLFHAAKSGNLPDVRTLLAEGADVNAKNEDGLTALMAASQNGRIDVVKLLLAAKADVNTASKKNGNTSLMLASSYGYTEVVKLLLENGAEVNAKNNEGMTALHDAIGCTDVIRLLKEAGAKE